MNDVVVRPNHELPVTLEDLSRFVLIGREKLVAVRAEIRAIDKVGLAKSVREQKLGEAQAISEAVLDAEVRIGQLMRDVVKGSGGDRRSDNFKTDSGVAFENSVKVETSNPTVNADVPATELHIGADLSRANRQNDIEPQIVAAPQPPSEQPAIDEPQVKAEPKTKADVIREAGFTPRQVQRFQELAEHPELVEQAKSEARANDDIVSRTLVLNKIKQAKREAELQRQVEELEQNTPKLPDGLFDVIVIDPAWAYGTGYDAVGRRCANPYPEMTQEQLKEIEIPAADNCVMFLWTTHKFIRDAFELLDTWGFEYRNMLVWDKKQMGMGNLFRMRCEFCLVGTKGKPLFRDVHDVEDIIEEQRREHSRKPEAFYELVNRLCVGRKLDYFSRTKREGWEVYGNDTEKFNVA